MTKQEFSLMVDELAQKAADIPFNEYGKALSVITEFKSFVAKYEANLNQFVLERIESIREEFKNMNRSKKDSDKQKFWETGVEELVDYIDSMNDENTFPE